MELKVHGRIATILPAEKYLILCFSLTRLFCKVITTGVLKFPDILGLVDSEITPLLTVVSLSFFSPLF